MRTLTTLALMVSSCGLSAQAGVIFFTGFEPPAYSTGTIIGQNGWTGTGGVVTITNPYAGFQDLGFANPNNATSATHGVSYDATTDGAQIVVLSDFANLSGSTLETWNVLAAGSSLGFMGQILVHNDIATFDTGSATIGTVAVTDGTYNRFSLVLNYANGTEAAFYNSMLIGTTNFVQPGATDLIGLRLGYAAKQTTGSTDTAQFDNVSVTTVPEPATFGFGLLGAASIIGFCGKRQR